MDVKVANEKLFIHKINTTRKKKEVSYEYEINLQSSPTGPAEHCAGGSLPKSCNS